MEKATADEVGKSCKRKAPGAIQRSSSLKREKKPSKKKLHVHNEMQKGIEATRLKTLGNTSCRKDLQEEMAKAEKSANARRAKQRKTQEP